MGENKVPIVALNERCPREAESYRSWLRSILEWAGDGRILTINVPAGWIAVPRESGGWVLGDEDERRIAAECRQDGSDVLALALDRSSEEIPPEPAPQIFAVPANATVLSEFSWRVLYPWEHVLVFSGSRRWIIYVTYDDCMVFAGEPNTVDRLAGAEAASLQSTFREWASGGYSTPAVEALARIEWPVTPVHKMRTVALT